MPDRAYSDSVNENLHDAVSAWFLGPQGENADMLKELFEQAVNLQKNSRLAYYPDDGVCPFFGDDSVRILMRLSLEIHHRQHPGIANLPTTPGRTHQAVRAPDHTPLRILDPFLLSALCWAHVIRDGLAGYPRLGRHSSQ
jgi:hypothetical protein